MPTPEEIRENQKKAWGASAGGCERSADWYRRNFAPAIDWLGRAVEATPGARLLDVACGAGQPALSLAALVGPSGKVTGIDLAPEMLAAAARQARAANLAQLELREMAAEQLSFADASFDGVTCAFGLMLCPDPVRAVAEMRRVTVAGKRVAVVVWDELANSPYLSTLFRSLAPFFPAAPPSDPKAPGTFRLGPPGELEGALCAGGLAQVSVHTLALELEFASFDEYWQVTLDQAAGLKARIATLADSEQSRLRAVLGEALGPFTRDGRVRIGASLRAGLGGAGAQCARQ